MNKTAYTLNKFLTSFYKYASEINRPVGKSGPGHLSSSAKPAVKNVGVGRLKPFASPLSSGDIPSVADGKFRDLGQDTSIGYIKHISPYTQSKPTNSDK